MRRKWSHMRRRYPQKYLARKQKREKVELGGKHFSLNYGPGPGFDGPALARANDKNQALLILVRNQNYIQTLAKEQLGNMSMREAGTNIWYFPNTGGDENHAWPDWAMTLSELLQPLRGISAANIATRGHFAPLLMGSIEGEQLLGSPSGLNTGPLDCLCSSRMII